MIKLKSQKGFSLIEMAIVMVILGLLLGGMMIPLSEQREVSQRQETERQLQEIRNALIGYAQANNALPCPVAAGAGDFVQALPTSATTCNSADDRVPYATLGIQGAVSGNNLMDAKHQPFRYRLTSAGAWQYAKTPIPLSPSSPPDIVVCNSSSGSTSTACGTGRLIANNVVAVVFSVGNDLGPSADELENTDNDSVFVMHTLEKTFDDIVIWIPQTTLIYEVRKTAQ